MYVRHGTITHAGMLLSRNGTTTGRYMILAYDVMQSVRCSDACKNSGLKSYISIAKTQKSIMDLKVAKKHFETTTTKIHEKCKITFTTKESF